MVGAVWEAIDGSPNLVGISGQKCMFPGAQALLSACLLEKIKGKTQNHWEAKHTANWTLFVTL